MPATSEWEPVETQSEWEPVATQNEWEAVPDSATATTTAPAQSPTVQPLSENVVLPSPVEALRQDPRAYQKPPGIIETAFGAVGEAAAAALNIPQAMVRSATGETPKQFTISTDAAGKEQLKQEDVPLHFQAGKPAIQFPRTEMQPEGNAIGRLVEGLLTPENIALFPFAASKAVQAAFLSKMAPAAVDAASRLVDPNTPPDKRREASTELLINGLMSFGIAKHMATPELKALAPATAQAVEETPQPKGDSNASSQPSATGIPQQEVRPRLGQEAPLRQQGETTTTQTEAAIKESQAVIQPANETAGNVTSPKPKAYEPGLEQSLEPPGGTAPDTGVSPPGGGLSTKTPDELARHESARMETEANFRKELDGGEAPLGINRPDIEDPSLKTLTDTEFDAEFKSAREAVNAAEESLDEFSNPSPDHRQSIAKAQDRWSAASLERLRRNNLDVHTEDIFRQMNDLASLGSDSAYAKFKVLANILQERGGVKQADATGAYSQLPDRLLSNPDFKEALGGNLQKTKEWLERIQKEQATPVPTRFGQGGPGSAAAGEPGSYDPAVELSDALKTVREPDPLKRAETIEKVADTWEAGKSAAQRAWGQVVAAKESIKSNLLEQAEVTPLKRLISALDFQIQKSSAMSRDLGKSLETSHPNRTRRNGIAILVDAGLDPARVRDAIAQLPDKTPRRIRKAFEAAADLNAAERDTAERIKHYFEQRLQDAQQAGVLDRFLEDYYTHVWKRPERMPEELKNAMSNGRVVSYFESSRKRVLEDFISGVKGGLEPVLDPAAVLPKYNFNLDRAIASRAFVKKLSETTEADGRPTVAPKGTGKIVGGDGNPATIIKPNSKSGEASDYEEVNNPALRKWKWATNAPDGTPVLVEGDLVVHPDAAQRIMNIMERQRLTPGKTMRALIRAGAEVKGAKLGVLSPFHQIHVGSHALWHLVNPFSLKPEIDWTHPATRFAVEKGGLKLAADFHDKTAFTEGVGPGLIVQKIVPYARAYSEYLFESFIPRLKLKTFEAVYQRDLNRFEGKLTPEQIAARSGDSVNSAYGELNRLWLGKDGRDPRLQRAMQVTLLAPDFLEARARFIAKAFTKHGVEERMALFVMGAGLYVTARVLNQLIDGDPHTEPGMMFSVRKDGVNYSVRSVLGDTEHALTDWRSFVSHRINPLTTRTGVEIITGRDLKTGEKRTTLQEFQDLLSQIRPAQIDSMFANDREWYDGLVQSVGLTKRHQPTPAEIAKKKASEEKENTNPSKVEIIYKKDFRGTPKKGIQPTPK